MIYCKTIQKSLNRLTMEQIAYCKSCSALVALYKRTGMKDCEERVKGKIAGFLTCLRQFGTISEFDYELLLEWFSSADRSKEVHE